MNLLRALWMPITRQMNATSWTLLALAAVLLFVALAEDDFVLNIEMFLLAIAWLPALAGTGYLWSVYWGDPVRPRSWLIRTFAITATVLTASAIYFCALVVLRLMGIPALGLAPFSGLVVFFICAAPSYCAYVVWSAAHGHSSRPRIPTNGTRYHDRALDENQ